METAPGLVIELENITVEFGRHKVLDGVSMKFSGGSMGLLGPNGAGKSTLLKTLLGFIDPEAGGGKVLGFDVRGQQLALRQRVGYMPENDCHIPGMNAVTFVGYAGQLAGMQPKDAMQRAHEILFYVGLGEARYRNVETYSTGMKQRIKLAQALVHDPELIFLDEPTNGLDPKGRMEMLALIRDLSRRKGVNVILSSHLLRDVEETCESVVMLSHGKVVGQGTIQALKGASGELFEVRLKADQRQHDRFAAELAARGCSAAPANDG